MCAVCKLGYSRAVDSPWGRYRCTVCGYRESAENRSSALWPHIKEEHPDLYALLLMSEPKMVKDLDGGGSGMRALGIDE